MLYRFTPAFRSVTPCLLAGLANSFVSASWAELGMGSLLRGEE